ncbi:MAG: AMP-binding protein [Pseudonocardia sp.]
MHDTPIVESFVACADRDPGAPALVWYEREISYGELYRAAVAQRDRMTRLGLGTDEPVGVLAAKSPDAVALVLGCLLARRPFLLPSATLPHETLRTLFGAAGCARVLTPDDDLALGERAAARVAVPPDTSFMLTTSGSTGTPKIVPVRAIGVDRFAAWASVHFGIGPGTTVLNHAPLNFDLCLLDVWTTLARGGRVVLCDPAQAANGKHLLGLLARHEVHLVQAVPMFYRLLAEAAGAHRFDRVEHVVFTGDLLPRRDLQVLPKLFPGARLHNVYGCTETNDSFTHEVDPARLPAGPVPLGDPLPGVQVLVIAQDGTPLRGRGTGELYVSTPFQTGGYLGEWADVGRFGPHPHGTQGVQYYRTGDLVVRGEDGQLVLRGRDDFQVKVRGVRIDMQDIERILLDHPAVAEAAVVAVPDDTVGHALTAAVRRVRGSGLNSLVVRGHCARWLAPAAVPTTVRITDDPLPRTSTGKVDRNLITEQSQPSR